MMAPFTCPSRWAATPERQHNVGLAGASISTRRADASAVDRRHAAAVGVSGSAGAAEVHRVPLGDGPTRAAVHAWQVGARVMELAPAAYVSVPALALSIAIWSRFTSPLVQARLRGHGAS